VQTLVVVVTVADKQLEFKGEAKNAPRSSEDAQGEKQKGEGKKKYKGKMKMSKGSEYQTKSKLNGYPSF
jgi:hypothetical protein